MLTARVTHYHLEELRELHEIVSNGLYNAKCKNYMSGCDNCSKHRLCSDLARLADYLSEELTLAELQAKFKQLNRKNRL